MFSKFILGATALAATFTALPAEAGAHGRYYDGYNQPSYGRYYAPRRVYYAPAPVYYAPRRVYVDQGYGGDRYYRGDRYYDERNYDNRYYGRAYRDDGYYRRRCGSGTTGAIVGGAGGALLGRSIGRGRDYYGYRRGSGTGGAILGGAVGALLGREIGRGC